MVDGDTLAGAGGGARGSGPGGGGGRAGTELARCSASEPAAARAARAASPARRESENFFRLRLSAASAVSGCSGPLRVVRSGLRCESLPESEPLALNKNQLDNLELFEI